jgi:hypothetical protein
MDYLLSAKTCSSLLKVKRKSKAGANLNVLALTNKKCKI